MGCADPASRAGRDPGPDLEAQRPSAPKRITMGMRGDPKTLSAKLNSAAGAGGVPGVSEIEEMVNAGLAHVDSGRVVRAQLAEQVPTVENGLWRVAADGTMETTWRIRPGATWHDGTPFTSEDLLFTSRVEQDRELPIFRNVAYGSIDRIEAPDALTITIRWKQPFIQADTMFTNDRALPMPRHILEKPYLEDKQGFPNHPYWNREYIGTGPYRLREWSPGSHLVLEANPQYTLGAPKISQIEVKFIPDPGTLASNILAGAVDLTLGGRLSLEWAIQVRDQWRDGRIDLGTPTSMISAYPQFIDPNPPIVADAQFRRALLHAIDRQEIIDSIVAGLAPMGQSIVSSEHPEWPDVEARVAKYDYNPARAVQIIQGLGYTRASDGIFRSAAGERLSVEIRTTANDDGQMKTMFATANYWQQVGVASEQVPVPQQRESDREYRATRTAFEIVRQPGGWKELERFYGPNTPLPENNYTGVNRTRHRNPDFDGLIDRFHRTVPRPERMEVLGQIVSYMTDRVLILPVFWDPTPTMVANRLKNLSDPSEVWDVYLWDVG